MQNIYYRIKYSNENGNYYSETSNLDEAKRMYRTFEKDINVTDVKFVIVNELEEEITSEQLPE